MLILKSITAKRWRTSLSMVNAAISMTVWWSFYGTTKWNWSMVSRWIRRAWILGWKRCVLKRVLTKTLYLAFHWPDLWSPRCRSGSQEGRPSGDESQIQAAVDLLANSYQRPITSMMKSGLSEKPRFDECLAWRRWPLVESVYLRHHGELD